MMVTCPGTHQPSLFRSLEKAGIPGTFFSASSRYYNNEYREYPEQFGMAHYFAKEDIAKEGYSGASGWGFHNDVMYDNMLRFLKKSRGQSFLVVTKTLDMHQPYPYYGITYENMPESVRTQGTVTVCGMYWVDQTVKHFFEEAEKEGLMDDRTLFVITSDHNPHSGGEYKTLVQKPQDKKSVAPIPLIFVSKNLEPLKISKVRIMAARKTWLRRSLRSWASPYRKNSWGEISCSLRIIPMPWAILAVKPITIPPTYPLFPRWTSQHRIGRKRTPWQIM